MKEERVTKMIMAELDRRGYEILVFDYPQSGTGVLLSPDYSNLPKINLDIIAIKNQELYLFENKDRYYPKDFEKLHMLKNNIDAYEESFKEKLDIDVKSLTIKVCIGLPKVFESRIKPDKYQLVDEIWGMSDEGE